MQSRSIRHAVSAAAAIALVLTPFAASPAAAAGQPGQQIFDAMFGIQRNVDSAFYNGAAQTLTADMAGTISWVELPMSRADFTTQALTIELRSGSPDGTLLATSDSVPAASILTGTVEGTPDIYGWIRFTFSTPITVAAGDALAIVVPRTPMTNTVDSTWGWGKAGSDVYANGAAYGGVGPTDWAPNGYWDGPYWDGSDFAFRTPVSDIPLPSPTVDLTFAPAHPLPNGEATFTIAWNDPGGMSVDHGTLAFGDGTTTTDLATTTHTYTTEGDYTASVSVWASDGRTATDSVSLHVGADTTPPSIQAPAQLVANAGAGAEGATVYFDMEVWASDDFDGWVPVTCDPASGALFPIGTTAVTCTADDSVGNHAEKNFDVVVQAWVDTTPPWVSVPWQVHVFVGASETSTAVTFDASAYDEVDGSVAVSCDPASGSSFDVGTTSVRCTATDAAGNVGEASFSAVVDRDSDPPSIYSTWDQTWNATSPTGASVGYSSIYAWDSIDGIVPVTCDPTSGSVFQIGTTTVHCTATDQAGNAGTASFNVTVVGAAGQLTALRDYVASSYRSGSTLSDKLTSAKRLLDSGKIAQTIEELRSFENGVTSQSGKKLTPYLASEYVRMADQIIAVLGG